MVKGKTVTYQVCSIYLQSSCWIIITRYFSIAAHNAENPWLNITGCVHPKQIADWLASERSTLTNNNGLYARFQCLCFEPWFPYPEEVPPERRDVPSLARHFFAIHALHQEQFSVYTCSEEAAEILMTQEKKFVDYLRTHHSKDSYMSGKFLYNMLTSGMFIHSSLTYQHYKIRPLDNVQSGRGV